MAVDSTKDGFRFKVVLQANETMQLRVILEAEYLQQAENEPSKVRAGRNQNMSFVHASLENVAHNLVQINNHVGSGVALGVALTLQLWNRCLCFHFARANRLVYT